MNIIEFKNPIIKYKYENQNIGNDYPSNAEYLAKTIRILDNYQMLQDLSLEDQEKLIKHIKIKKYYHNQLVYKHNSECKEVSVLVSGALKLGWNMENGKYLTDIFVPIGTIINIVPIFSGRPYVHDHIAQGKTILASIPSDIFIETIQNNAQTLTKILKLICARTQISRERKFFYSTESLRTRLTKELIFLADFHSYQEKDRYFLELKLNQENFAELLRTTRQSINREFAWLAEQHIIEVKYNQIIINDYEALKALALGESNFPATKFL